jgi:N-acetylglucosaminyldiphosphoundecaprenol N-acetyl-beta-D-mannosaminyltransferase
VIAHGKKNVLGVLVDAVDYEAAVAEIISAATSRRPLAVSALAVHGVMTAVQNDDYRAMLNSFDLVTPDGQPVRWALNLLYKTRLADRVYGPSLTMQVLSEAESAGLSVYFYGSRREVLDRLRQRLQAVLPLLQIAGTEPSKFRRVDRAEFDEIATGVRSSGASIAFVGLGCPRQEVFVHALRARVDIPVLAVGVAFDYEAGVLRKPPRILQRVGLEWAWRLALEPRRLWRRYLLLNPTYLAMLAAQWAGIRRSAPCVVSPKEDLIPA